MNKPKFKNMGLLVTLVLGIIALALVFPYLVSAYHIEAAGRAMAEPTRAQEHLRQAIAWDQDNAQAYRLLAKAFGEEGDWSAAVEALSRYTELRPNNPLGHMELALAYEALLGSAPGEEAKDLDARIVEEWRRARVTVEEMLARGEAERSAKRYDEAMAWYERTMRLEPDLGDTWYFLGRNYESLKEWTQAIKAYKEAMLRADFQHTGRSNPPYRLGLVLRRHLDPPQLEDALALYDQALAIDDFATTADEADCHFQRGDVLRVQKGDINEYMAEFERAIALDPKHAWAHARLGWAYYVRDHDTSRAESEVLRAVELSPRQKWFYIILGDLYRQEGHTAQAAAAYEEALAIDPDFEPARRRLRSLGVSR